MHYHSLAHQSLLKQNESRGITMKSSLGKEHFIQFYNITFSKNDYIEFKQSIFLKAFMFFVLIIILFF